MDKRLRTAVVLCAITGALIALALGRLFAAMGFEPPWWLDVPALFGCFALVWLVYDRWVWRWKLFGSNLSGVLDLSGKWTGEVVSDHNGGTRSPADMIVRQTATRLLVTMTTEHSESHSTMAALCSSPGANQGVRYVYANRPRTLTPGTMAPHEGMVRLSLSHDSRALTGDYEADRHRSNTGRLRFVRQ